MVPYGELDLSLTDCGGCLAPPGALGAAELGERRLFVYQNRIELGLVKKSGQILGQVLIHVFFGLLAELLQLLHRTWLLRPGGPRGQITLNQKIVGDLNGGGRGNGGILCVSQGAALLLRILPDGPPIVGQSGACRVDQFPAILLSEREPQARGYDIVIEMGDRVLKGHIKSSFHRNFSVCF